MISARFDDEPDPPIPRLGISLGFQRRPDLDESYDRAYREGLELAARRAGRVDANPGSQEEKP